MQYHSERPLVVQSDRTIFLEVQHEQFETVREQLHAFAELVKSPEYIHTYRLTPLSLWNAAASGWTADKVLHALRSYAKFPVADVVERSISEDMHKYGRYRLCTQDGFLLLIAERKAHIKQLAAYPAVSSFLDGNIFSFRAPLAADADPDESWWAVAVKPEKRGELKQESIKLGFPIQDEAGYAEGDRLELSWLERLPDGQPFKIRDYQREAVDEFFGKGVVSEGHGVLVLPCGAGKTIIGMDAIVRHQCAALILTTNTSAVRQWKRELLEKTTLTEQQVGEYTGSCKQIRPITVATYQILTYKDHETGQFQHMDVFQRRGWGLIIYDEVHLLPAPVFRATAAIQSTRRLGLTATLIREDGREKDVFSLIGPKRYDAPWKQLESDGYIAKALCTEVRVAFDPALKEAYYKLPVKRRTRLAQENPNKIDIVRSLLDKHHGQPVLIIGQYIHQLEQLGTLLRVPVITGQMPQEERDEWYDAFRKGRIDVLAVSKVANFAIDLPDATVAIQISGTFGSRQEEAQRLGRILRPKKNEREAYFYHIVTEDSKDQEYAAKRQRFLIEQGYRYQLVRP